MKILFGSTVLLHSIPIFYDKEKSGMKRNTVRFIDTRVNFPLDKLTHVRISEVGGDSCEYFTRKISDISSVGEVLGKIIYVISWDSDKGA